MIELNCQRLYFILIRMWKRGCLEFKHQFYKKYFFPKLELVKEFLNVIKQFFVRPIFDHKKALGIQKVESDYRH